MEETKKTCNCSPNEISINHKSIVDLAAAITIALVLSFIIKRFIEKHL